MASIYYRKYTDLTPDGKRVYDGVMRALTRVKHARSDANIAARRDPTNKAITKRLDALQVASERLYDVKSELLGRKRPWSEGIEVRVNGVPRFYHYDKSFPCTDNDGPLDLDHFPENSQKLGLLLSKLMEESAREAAESRAQAYRDKNQVKSQRDPHAHWKKLD